MNDMFRATLYSSSGGQLYEYNFWCNHCVLVAARYVMPCRLINPLKPELNPICYLLALLAHHFLHVSRIRVKSLTLR